MRIRVVKPKPLSEDEKVKKPASEAQMTLAVQSWVKEFKSSKATCLLCRQNLHLVAILRSLITSS